MPTVIAVELKVRTSASHWDWIVAQQRLSLPSPSLRSTQGFQLKHPDSLVCSMAHPPGGWYCVVLGVRSTAAIEWQLSPTTTSRAARNPSRWRSPIGTLPLGSPSQPPCWTYLQVGRKRTHWLALTRRPFLDPFRRLLFDGVTCLHHAGYGVLWCSGVLDLSPGDSVVLEVLKKNHEDHRSKDDHNATKYELTITTPERSLT